MAALVGTAELDHVQGKEDADKTGDDEDRDHDAAPLKTVKQGGSQPEKQKLPDVPYQDNLLAVLMAHPITRHHLGGFEVDMFAGEERQKLVAWLKKHEEVVSHDVPAELQPLETYVKIIQLKAETRYDGWSEQDSSLEVAKLLRQTEVEHKKQTKTRLINELREVEASGDDAAAGDLRAKLYALIKETA